MWKVKYQNGQLTFTKQEGSETTQFSLYMRPHEVMGLLQEFTERNLWSPEEAPKKQERIYQVGKRTYQISKDSQGRDTLTILPPKDIPFSTWRDLGRVCGTSINTPDGEVFTCLVPDTLPEAERILQGALFQKKD